jgi:RimJ/RimL family protein N-acetyltransferase
LYTETYAFRKFHISIYKKAGLKKEGRMRDHIFERGKFQDSILHSILKNEYLLK